MRVVEAQDPFAVGTVKRQRVLEAVRALCSDGYPYDFEFHPESVFMDHDRIAVQIDQGV
jgi:hypothetical protein